MKRSIITMLALTLALPLTASAADALSPSEASAPQASAAMTDGEVRKVDKEAGKITIRHAPIDRLGMPAMTMVFQVKDRALLDQVKAGDKIRFQAENPSGQFTVTRIEPGP